MVVMALDLLHCNWMARRDKVGLPIIQFCTRISAGRLCLLSTPSLQAVRPDALDGRTVKRHASLKLLLRSTTSPPPLHVTAWCPRASSW